jgi:MFS family permease
MRSRYAAYVLAVMVGINFLNYLDRYILSAAAPLIQEEFHLTDFQLGVLASAFLVVYAVSALPFGIWADRGVRRTVIGVGVAIWSIATLFTGLARSYWQLLVTRAVLGIGEASYYPAGTSLLGDFFTKGARARAGSIWSAGTVFGIAVAFIGGGQVAQHLGWRAAFYMTAAPGLILALLAFTLREPPRGSAEARGPKVEKPKDADWKQFRELWRIPTLRATIMAETALFFVLAVLATFLPLYIHRRFGLATGAAATYGGGVLIGGGLIGTLAGGWLGDHFARRNPAGHLLVGIVGFVAGAVTVAVAIVIPSLYGFLGFGLLSAAFLYMYNAPFTALKQNIVVPSLRASAITLSLFLAHLLGDSWSPSAVGYLSDRLHSLGLAILVTCPTVLLLAAAIALVAVRTAGRDTETMESTWAEMEPVPVP